MDNKQANAGGNNESVPEIPLAEVKSKLIHRFHQYWLGKGRNGNPPARADIEIEEIVDLLPYILLVDIEAAPFRVRYRVCGTRVAALRGDLTNSYLDESKHISPENQAPLQAEYRLVVRERRPHFAADTIVLKDGTQRRYNAAIWPLSSDGQTIDKCIVVEDFGDVWPEDIKAIER